MADRRKITAVTIHYDGGRTTYHGEGEAQVISTQTKVEGVSQPFWPWTNFVTVHMEIKPVPDPVGKNLAVANRNADIDAADEDD